MNRFMSEEMNAQGLAIIGGLALVIGMVNFSVPVYIGSIVSWVVGCWVWHSQVR